MSLLAEYENQFPVVVNALKNANQRGRLAHAYLLHSDSETTRTNFAVLLAQFSSCRTPLPDGAACGECKSCLQLMDGSYPELYTLMPTSKSRMIQVGENPNPAPDTVRWFEEQFYLTSVSEAGMKIGIIYDCDRMNEMAQNAFLKTLEEPPQNTFFVLVTGNPASLLPTTRSRCQSIVLLRNQTDYSFEGSQELFAALHHLLLNAAGNLVEAENSAEVLIAIAKGLEAQAQDSVTALWSDRLERAQDLEPPARKQIDQRYQAAVRAEYLKLRSLYLSSIHAWFAQSHQLSQGVDLETLANPEISRDITTPSALDEEKCFKGVQQVEKLLSTLKWSVNEELALREFCLTTAMA